MEVVVHQDLEVDLPQDQALLPARINLQLLQGIQNQLLESVNTLWVRRWEQAVLERSNVSL